ncbi:alpha/beta hydrolase [Herbidospora galbida]|uniref:Alpha/beta hydrolase n=1 Tax=Herbidospora galbida TaxID=2575442 RepID=A0A4U3MAA7_9ACTN|nr:alpha/beta hydrolase [Herbidospora galbida]
MPSEKTGPVPDWPSDRVDLGDLRLNYRTTPDGPQEKAVMVHGLAGSATNWTDLSDLLKDQVRTFAPDLPGAGWSPEPEDRDYSVSAHARAMVRFIEWVGGPVHLFGNSLGGAVSVRVAAQRPDLVKSLTLISPALPDLLPRVGPARVALSAVPGVAEFVVRRMSVTVPPERRIQATISMCYGDLDCVHPDRLAAAIKELRRRDDLPYSASAMIGSARGIVREYFRSDLWREAAQVEAPTLVIHGRRDRIVDARMASRASRAFRDVRIVTLPWAGHVAQMESPQIVAREARALIRECADAPVRL